MLVRILKRTAIGVAAFIFILWGSVWLLSPVITRWVAKNPLQQYGLELTESSSVRVNILLLRVTVSDLTVTKNEDRTLALDELVIDLAFWPLLKKQIYVESFRISGLDSSVEQTGDMLSVAGFEIPQTVETEAAEGKSNTEDQSATPHIVIPTLSILDSKVTAVYEGATHTLLIDDLSLTNLDVTGDTAEVQVSIAAKINDSLLAAKVSLQKDNQRLNISSDLELGDFNLGDTQFLVPDGPAYEGLLNIDVATEVVLLNEKLDLIVKNGSISVSDIKYNDGVYEADGDNLELSINSLDVSIDPEFGNNIAGDFNINSKAVHTYLLKDGSTLASVDEFSVANIKFSQRDSNNNFSVAAINVENILLSQRKVNVDSNGNGKESPVLPLLALAGLEVNQVEGDDHSIRLSEILINEPVATVKILDSGELENLVAISEPVSDSNEKFEHVEDEVDSSAVFENENSTPDFSFSIDKVAFVGGGKVNFSDRSISPAFEKNLEVEQFEISNIDSANVEQALSFVLKAKDDDFFSIDVHGKTKPFGELINLNLEGEVKEFPLPQASAYTTKHAGFGVQRGQLNTDLVVNVVDSVIDGETIIYINGAKFGETETVDVNADTNSVINQGSVPLNVALNMIKDGDGNIKLTVPLSGNVNDPSFGVQHIVGLVVQKAALSQAKNYLLNTFVPYAKVVSVAMAAGSYALKVRFEDLPYEPGMVDVGEDQQEYLQQLIALMQEDDNLVVHVCPVATPNEPIPVNSESVDLQTQNSGAQENKELLLELANSRANNFKRTIIEQGAIESSRLSICAPVIDTEELALPRISLSTQ